MRSFQHIQDQKQIVSRPRYPNYHTMKCQYHQNMQITYFNLLFPKNDDDIQKGRKIFLCQNCYKQLIREFGIDSPTLNKIIKKQTFQQRFISPIGERYKTTNIDQLRTNYRILSNGEKYMISEIQKAQHNMNNMFQNLQNSVKDIFTPLKTSFDPNILQSYRNEQFTAQMIRNFYLNHKNKSNYAALLQNDNNVLVENLYEAIHKTLQGTQSYFKRQIEELYQGMKLYIVDFKDSQNKPQKQKYEPNTIKQDLKDNKKLTNKQQSKTKIQQLKNKNKQVKNKNEQLINKNQNFKNKNQQFKNKSQQVKTKLELNAPKKNKIQQSFMSEQKQIQQINKKHQQQRLFLSKPSEISSHIQPNMKQKKSIIKQSSQPTLTNYKHQQSQSKRSLYQKQKQKKQKQDQQRQKRIKQQQRKRRRERQIQKTRQTIKQNQLKQRQNKNRKINQQSLKSTKSSSYSSSHSLISSQSSSSSSSSNSSRDQRQRSRDNGRKFQKRQNILKNHHYSSDQQNNKNRNNKMYQKSSHRQNRPRQIIQRPARTNCIEVIAEQYCKQSRQIIIEYVINRADPRQYRLDVRKQYKPQFIAKYPDAYNKFYNMKLKAFK